MVTSLTVVNCRREGVLDQRSWMVRGEAQLGTQVIGPEAIQGRPGTNSPGIGAGAALLDRVVLAHRNRPAAIVAGLMVFAVVDYNLALVRAIAVRRLLQPIGG